MRRVLSKLKSLLARRRAEDEMRREIAAHLQLLEDDYRRQGMDADQARLAARRRYGNVELAKELHREERTFAWLESLWRDLRHAWRGVRASPGFTAVAVGSIALGIGAASAIFSLVHALLIDPFPYKDAERMAPVRFTSESVELGHLSYTIEDFQTIRHSAKTIEDAITSDFRSLVATDGLVERVTGAAYPPNFFEFMGVPAMIGRTWRSSDFPDETNPPRIAVLSSAFWQRRYYGDPDIVGKTIELNHERYTIFGVLPPRFTWQRVEVFLPLNMTPDSRMLRTLTRIRPGVSMDQAAAEMQVLTEGFAERHPELYAPFQGFRVSLASLNDRQLGPFKGTIFILWGAVGCLLLIACGNVAILLLARASARHGEIAVRLALGASGGRVIRQLLTESVLLSFAGGVLGVLLAYRGVPAIVALIPDMAIPREPVIAVNGIVVAVSFAVAVVTGILFGLAPALQAAKTDVRAAIDENGASVAGGRGMGKVRGALVMTEVALTVVLLAVAGIAVRGLVSVIDTPLGYDPSRVVGLTAAILPGRYTTWPERSAYYQQILERLRATPGVESVGNTNTAVPPYIGARMPLKTVGQSGTPEGQQALVGLVGGDYFSTIRVPLLHGRLFTPNELSRAAPVAVINEEAQRRFFPDANPEGRRIRLPNLLAEGSPPFLNPPGFEDGFEIVGVVGTVRNRGIENEPEPAIYLPEGALLSLGTTFLVRTAGDPAKSLRALQEAFVAVDPGQPVAFTQTLNEGLENDGFGDARFSAALFSVFAGIGLLLAASGVFSIVSYAVTCRSHEFGIRRALGATTGDILHLATSSTAKLLFAGIIIGLASMVGLSPILGSYLRRWDPGDPAAFVIVIFLLLVVALAACWLPAKRATAVQPVTTRGRVAVGGKEA